jgi:segregation and condensation protein B
MSLKAKLEAVIYAAEEPVTLAQLAALFAPDALEWKAAQAPQIEVLEVEAAVPIPLISDELAYLDLDAAGAATDAGAESAGSETQPASDSQPVEGLEDNPATEAKSSASAESAGGTEVSPADAEIEARRLARLRDREVRAILRQFLDELIADYAADDRGVEIREIAGGFRMATKPECHDAVRSFVKSLKPALKLSLPALETLAVVAYKQPVTAPEVNEIRGVDSSGVFGSLLARKLIATAGRKPVIGRPILYKTTREFLLRFGLKDVSELPSMEEFEKMAAIELDEPELSAQEGPDLETTAKSDLDLTFETDSTALDETAEEYSEEEFSGASPVTPETAVMAASHESPTPAEAAPAAPPATEQAETETLPHAERDSTEEESSKESQPEEGRSEKGSAEKSREDE